jgi:putative ABC transport system permease protein
MSARQNLEIFVQDIRYAARGLLRTPTFTIAAILTVSLGVGAGTAVFSVVDRILFRSLPYRDADHLVSVGMVAPIAPQEFLLGYDYLDWRGQQTPFESFASWIGPIGCDLTEANAVRLRCAKADTTLLETLGIQPILGRTFNSEESQPNAPKVALISYGLWKSRFAGNPGVLGKALSLDGQSATILGVLPPQFELPTLERADVLLAQALDAEEQRSRKTAILVTTVARLKPGVTPEQAKAALQPLFEEALRLGVSPEFHKEIKLRVRPLRDRQIQDTRLVSWILLASVLAVLLIACANVANLLLARAATRQREVAVRAALGAGRGRLIRQVFTESVLLGLAGGGAGCALAFLLLRLFVAIAPEGIPRLNQAGIDMRVLLFTLAVSLASGILFGLAPALRNLRPEALAGWRTVGARHHLFRNALVAAQICVSLIMLTGTGLLLRSLWNLQNQPLGMRTDNVLAAGITLGRKTYSDPARRRAFFEELETRLSRIPGVAEVAISDTLPPEGDLAGSMMSATFQVQGRPPVEGAAGRGMVREREITPGYFATLGIPVLRGRGFREEDRNPDVNVVVLSDMFARRMFPGEDPMGKQIRSYTQAPWQTVIGVVGNVRNKGLVEANDPEWYTVRKHSRGNLGLSGVAILRTQLDPRIVAPRMRSELAALDPTLPVNIETMQQRVDKLAERPRFQAVLLSIFAATGLLLAAIGLYGVLSFQVAQRIQEIGVRMALGGTPRAISRLVLGRAARWTVAGAVLGVIGSLFAVRLIETTLFRVSAQDPRVLAGALAVLFGAAFVAAWIPSHRASRADPMEALRHE